MSISKNEKLDIAYIQLRKGKVEKSFEVIPGVIIDTDKKGNAIGIEILSIEKLAPIYQKNRKIM